MLNSKLPEFKSQEFGLCVNFRLSKYVFLLRPRVIFQLALYKKQNNPVERSQKGGRFTFFFPFFLLFRIEKNHLPTYRCSQHCRIYGILPSHFLQKLREINCHVHIHLLCKLVSRNIFQVIVNFCFS